MRQGPGGIGRPHPQRNLRDVEALLTAQIATLNAMFVDLSRCGLLNAGQYVATSEIYMRLALKAQAQCRATAETLAAIKNPLTVFTRQANIAQGPQQVNNAIVPAIPAASCAAISKTQQNEVLEAHGERVYVGPTHAAGQRNQALAPMEALNRPTFA